MQMKGFCEKSVEDNIWTEENCSDKLKKFQEQLRNLYF
jgi:hypothetical protein